MDLSPLPFNLALVCLVDPFPLHSRGGGGIRIHDTDEENSSHQQAAPPPPPAPPTAAPQGVAKAPAKAPDAEDGDEPGFRKVRGGLAPAGSTDTAEQRKASAAVREETC
jgi:hypothetical protein